MIVDKTLHIAHVGTFGNRGPWLHLNLGDVCPPGHDLREILREPKGRMDRMGGWWAALRTWKKGLLYAKSTRSMPLVGASIEAEEIVPVPHDMRMVSIADKLANYGYALRTAMSFIPDIVGVRVVLYGATQVLAAHVMSDEWEHRLQTDLWYDWHRPGGTLRGITPCQSFYRLATDNINGVVAWIDSALDRHAAVGHGTTTRPLTVFVTPELQGHAKSGIADDFASPDYADLGLMLRTIDHHPLECRVVSWFKASTQARADRAMQIVNEAASNAGLSVSS